MARSIMGLEIGSTNIKIIETVKKGVTLNVQKFSLLNTPTDCVNNGVINNIEPIRKVIAEELRLKRYRAKQVIVIVQSSNIIIRNAVMDKQPEKVIRQLLEIKTEDYLPVERGQYQIDFKVTNEFEEDGVVKNKLLLVAAPNAVVLPAASLVKSLKLNPILISIPSEALGNVFNANSRMIYEGIKNVMVLDIGGRSTTATIVSEEEAILTRMIDFGVESINEIINEAGLSQKVEGEAEEDYLSGIIRPQIEYNIVSEVERILQFYYSSYGSGIVKKIYLTGGGASIKGIRGYIRDALNIPTEKLTRFDTVTESPGIEFESYARFFVNILGAINGL